MIKLATLAVIGAAALATTPVYAGHAKRHIAHCGSVSVGDQECTPAQRADPYNVYSYDGRLIGRDPDANVRMRLRDEDARFRNSW